MHTEAIETLVEEVRLAILKLDRIAYALEKLTQPPTFVDQYAPYRQPKPGPLCVSQLDQYAPYRQPKRELVLEDFLREDANAGVDSQLERGRAE
jgi:hypothetical protein